MIDSNDLRLVSKDLFPGNFDELIWGNAWRLPIEQGKSLEWAVFIAIIAAFAQRGWDVAIPALSNTQIADCFTSDNRFPVHFTGRPGHQPTSGKMGTAILSCLIPKAVVRQSSECFSIFREGWPYHQIHASTGSKERPDILIARGSPNFTALKLDKDMGVVTYEYLDGNGEKLLSGSLRAINASSPQVIDLFQREALFAKCVVECSVNKLEARAALQLHAYAKTFFVQDDPSVILVTGVPIPSSYPVCPVTLTGSRDDLFNSLKISGEYIAKSIAESSIHKA